MAFPIVQITSKSSHQSIVPFIRVNNNPCQGEINSQKRYKQREWVADANSKSVGKENKKGKRSEGERKEEKINKQKKN